MGKLIVMPSRGTVLPQQDKPKQPRRRKQEQNEQLTRRIEDEVNRLFEAVGIPTPADEQHGWLVRL